MNREQKSKAIVHPNGKVYTLSGEGYLFDKLTEIEGHLEYMEMAQELINEDETINYQHEWVRTHNELQVMLEEHGGRYWHKGDNYRVYFRSDKLLSIIKKIAPDNEGPYSFSAQSSTSGHGHFFCLTTRRWSIGIGRFPDSPDSILNTVRMLFALEDWTAEAFSLASP